MKKYLQWFIGAGPFWRDRKAAAAVTKYGAALDSIETQFHYIVNYVRKRSMNKWNSIDDALIRVNKQSLRGLNAISYIASVQPLSAPFGVIQQVSFARDVKNQLQTYYEHHTTEIKHAPLDLNLFDYSADNIHSSSRWTADRVIDLASSTVTNEIFAAAPETIGIDCSPSSTAKAVAQARRALINTTGVPGNTIIVASQRGLQAVVAAAGTSFIPTTFVAHPIRKVGTVFEGMNLIYAKDCVSSETDENSIVVTVVLDDERSNRGFAGYVYAPFIPVALSSDPTPEFPERIESQGSSRMINDPSAIYHKIRVV